MSYPKILSHPAALCNSVRRIAEEAGELTLEYFDGIKDTQEQEKSDGSPVTQADKDAETLITKRLNELTPGIVVIGEESYAESKCEDLKNQEYFWLVDPIDGTKAFLRGEGDFTVNIALIYKNRPVIGVIYAPEKGELYAGHCYTQDDARAFRYFEDSETEKEIKVRAMPLKGLTVMSSSYRGGSRAQDAFLEQFKISKIVQRSSSIKICAIASGKADIYPRFGPTCEWDTAAGHAILRAIGGDIRDMTGKPLRYGCGREDLLNPNFIAASCDLLDSMEMPEK